MEKLKIRIGSDYLNETDEIRKLTIDLKNMIESLELDELESKDIEFEKSDDEVERGKGDLVEWGSIILPLVLSPAATIALIKTLHIWIKSKVDRTIAKTVSIDLKNKKYVLKGYSENEVSKILEKLKLGE